MRISDWSSDVCSSDLDQRVLAQESGFAAHIGARHQPEAAVAFQQTIICDKRRAFLRQRRLHDGMAPTFYGTALRFFEMRAAPAPFCRTLPQRGADIKAGTSVGSAGDLDRKSVVLRERVSVRVDLGGRRIFKKKKI